MITADGKKPLAMIGPDGPPDRIYHWRNTQLSIVKFSGGMTLYGHSYQIAIDEDGQPLVRADVLQREAREKADRLKADRKAQKMAAEQAQGAMF